jgi:hypothetical protein
METVPRETRPVGFEESHGAGAEAVCDQDRHWPIAAVAGRIGFQSSMNGSNQ